MVSAAHLWNVVATRQEALNVAGRLAQALSVFDQRDADKSLAVFAKTDPWGDRDIGALEQELREGEAADRPKGGRHRRPGEHRRPRYRDLPTGLPQSVDQDIAARAITLADLGDTILRPIQCRRGRHLYRREGAVIEIGLDARQRRNQPRIADRETDAPAGHRIGLAERGKLDRDVARPRHLEDRGRRLVIEINLGVGDVGKHDDFVPPAERNNLAVEVEVHSLCRRIGRKIEHDRDWRRDAVAHCLFQFGEEIEFRADRHVANRGARHDETEGMDWIAGIWNEDDITGRSYSLCEIGEPLLRAESDDDLPLGIEINPESA